uniref:growth hormone-regulated TBC protein 1 n=1 Tax=Myxine glutinosa TaxID=7769 RepID=UPI00358FA834
MATVSNGSFHGENVDMYGFERPADFDLATYEEFMSHYLSVLVRRAQRWDNLVGQKLMIRRSLKVKRFSRKGIPSSLRSVVWLAVSGAQARLDANPNYFSSLQAAEKSSALHDVVSLDLDRTFPENVHFQSGANPHLRTFLYNVLTAYGHHNPAVGYCQGMNFIAGYLLLVTKNEEQAFWLLDALISHILPDFYTPAMVGLKTELNVLTELVKRKLPALVNHMEKHSVAWVLVCSRWFLCLFVDVLPVETVFRLWDCLFYEGSKVMLRAALALMLHFRTALLESASFSAIVSTFRYLPQNDFTLNCHTFMQAIFKEPGSLPLSTIDHLRQSCRE